MTTLTDKELIKEIKGRIGSLDVRDNIERRAYEIALASLEAEPVVYMWDSERKDIDAPGYYRTEHLVFAESSVNQWGGRVVPLYTAPPAPVALAVLERLQSIVADPRALPRRKEWVSGQQYSYVLLENVEAMVDEACRTAMLQSGNFRENKNSSTNNFREIAETSTNYPVIPSEVLSAILKVAKIRADFDDFDGDRRGIGDCLDEAEQELIVTINKYASQLAAEPIATNDVREQQTAVPPVPEIQDDVAQAIENLKQKLVECNRYNYCADAVKNVEDACRAVSYSQADNQPASGNQAAESNRGNEWTGNPDIDNAIIMLDRIDTLENCDDDRIEAVKAVLRRLAGNSPVTPDSWISCSERMPAQDDWILIYSKHGEYMAGQVQGEYVELSDGTLSWLGNALFWMPLPEPPQEVNQ
ncbi:hypothetical protein BK376_25430 [Escherichia coli]|nr:hypothetical protein BK376_25430 [Escherichia coli]